MITTVTLNPSFDLTLRVDELRVGEVMVATSEQVDAAGKGVNVARCLAAQGGQVRAVVLLGAADAVRYGALVDLGDVAVVTIAGNVRTNVSLRTHDGMVTKINAPGPAVSSSEVDRLLAEVSAHIGDAEWVALCGSAPPGMPRDVYRELTVALRAGGTKVAIDTSGLRLAASLPARPDLVKPNRQELEASTGRAVRTVGDAIAASILLQEAGAQTVLCSLGARGALLVGGDVCLHAWTAPIVVQSDVGAGDSMLAGFLAHHDDPPKALMTAVAWGAAACQLPGSRLPSPDDVDLSVVMLSDDPDPNLPLDPH
jgi:1-phosphofructokinase